MQAAPQPRDSAKYDFGPHRGLPLRQPRHDGQACGIGEIDTRIGNKNQLYNHRR
jgi:hypothetical protein